MKVTNASSSTIGIIKESGHIAEDDPVISAILNATRVAYGLEGNLKEFYLSLSLSLFDK